MSSLKYPELKFMWKHRGNKNYILKSFISNGKDSHCMVFEDREYSRKVLGKIVTDPREGEAYHWPRLQHENLAPLLDIVSLNEKISIYISPFIGSNLRDIVHDTEFLNDSDCFDKKKGYAEDILWALDYLHKKSLCLMNLTDGNVHICKISDKAIISDFTCLILSERATKHNLGVPLLYQPPEIGTEFFDAVAAEMWACGVLMLQMFTRHVLPVAFIGDEAHKVLTSVRELSYSVLKETNPASDLDFLDVEELRAFLDLFLAENPQCRVAAKDAAISPFLYSNKSYAAKRKDHSKFYSSHKNLGYSRPLFQADWINAYPANRGKSSPFRDIYLDEAAKCRNKLKNTPCTNKFINLNFIPDSDMLMNTCDKNYKVGLTKLEKKSLQRIENWGLESSNTGDDKRQLTDTSVNTDTNLHSEFDEKINFSKLDKESMATGDNIDDIEKNKTCSDCLHVITEKRSPSKEKLTIDDNVLYNEIPTQHFRPSLYVDTNVSLFSLDSNSEIGDPVEELSLKVLRDPGKTEQTICSLVLDQIKDTSDCKIPDVGGYSHLKILNHKKNGTLNRSKSDSKMNITMLNNSTAIQKSDSCINYYKDIRVERNLDPSQPENFGSFKEKDETGHSLIFESDCLDSKQNQEFKKYKWQSFGFIESQPEEKSLDAVNRTHITASKYPKYTEPEILNNIDKDTELNHDLPVELGKQEPANELHSESSSSIRGFFRSKTVQNSKKDAFVKYECHRSDSYDRAISRGFTLFKINNRTETNDSQIEKQVSVAGPTANFCTCHPIDESGQNHTEEIKGKTTLSVTDLAAESDADFPTIYASESAEIINNSSDKKKTKKKFRRNWLWFLCPGSISRLRKKRNG